MQMAGATGGLPTSAVTGDSSPNPSPKRQRGVSAALAGRTSIEPAPADHASVARAPGSERDEHARAGVSMYIGMSGGRRMGR